MSVKFTLGLIVGAAIGGVIAHYLNTVEGRMLVNRVKHDTNDLSNNLNNRFGSKEPAPVEEERETVVVVGLEA